MTSRTREVAKPGVVAKMLRCGGRFVVAAALIVAFGEPVTGAKPHRQRRFIYNSDGGNIFIDKPTPMSLGDVYTYVDEVANSQVTTYFICPNFGMPVMYPSEVTDMLGASVEGERWSEMQSFAAEHPGTIERGIVNLRALVNAGHDPIELVVDRIHAKGMEAFITFRLNEIHDVENAESLIVSKFWRDHPEWRVAKPTDKLAKVFEDIIGGTPENPVHPVVATWFRGAMNFAVPEVRAFRLAELRECCERYDIDGLDLDFQRFPIYFPMSEGPRHVETMTSWVREVRDMTRAVGKKRGRPILLSARVLARPEQNLAIGLDPVSWCHDSLLDFVVVSHYLRNDFPLPIAKFRDRLPANAPVYASIEVESDRDDYRRIASRLWADGADGILLFNFFTGRESGKEPPFDLLKELGDPETIPAVSVVSANTPAAAP
jgi:hypothetical protein